MIVTTQYNGLSPPSTMNMYIELDELEMYASE